MTQPIDAGAIASNIDSTPAADTNETPAATNEQAPVSESPSEPQSEQQSQQQDDPDYVRRFNALARKERELQKQREEMQAKYSEYESYQKERSKLKENPLEFLESNGWKFQDLAEYVLNDKKPTPDQQVSALQKRIDQLEADRQREIEEREQREAQKKNQQTISEFKKGIEKTVSEKNEQFELINHLGEYETVYDVIESYYNTHGVVLDTVKAAEEVEKYLEQRFEKVASTSKFKNRFAQSEPAKSDEQASGFESAVQKQSEPRTLTNTIASAPAAPDTSEKPYLSDEESKKAAAEKLREWMLERKGYVKKS